MRHLYFQKYLDLYKINQKSYDIYIYTHTHIQFSTKNYDCETKKKHFYQLHKVSFDGSSIILAFVRRVYFRKLKQ